MDVLKVTPWLFAVASCALILSICLIYLYLYQRHQRRWHQQCRRYLQLDRGAIQCQLANQVSVFELIGKLYPVSVSERQRLQQLLEQAGIHATSALDRVRSAKLLLGITAALSVMLWQWLEGELFSAFALMLILVGYVLASNFPEYWLRRQANKAKNRQQQVVPDAIDLMVISIEAGLSLERTLEKVGAYLLDIEPMLAKQFLRTYAEIKVLGDPAQCLNKLAWRTGLPELARLANTLAMAQRYGSPLAETMRTISTDARQMRKMSLQEQAGKLPGRVTLIQMAFIMLPLLVLIITPTMNLLLESLR